MVLDLCFNSFSVFLIEKQAFKGLLDIIAMQITFSYDFDIKNVIVLKQYLC